ncbi:L-rhamnose-binding lectin CSL2-like [Mastacembelus armatus]|uniref:L-rhamnose-binding lectin CSL2-like n=1 Tax=Mastacembelus armatus TaxID=205130 RepID=UPI000E4609C4|nr:L-rhamnose-binding lectin CSL2-like [Mastacembelus armatus]
MKLILRLRAVFLLTCFCCSLNTRAEVTLTCDLDNYKHALNCDVGVIVVHNVTVSHRESEACVHGVPPDHLNPPVCSSTPVLNSIRNRCNGQHTCELRMDVCHTASPCLTRCVWMKTTYTCAVGKIYHVCQKDKALLYCGSQVIKVLMANYGRGSMEVCKYTPPYKHPASTSCSQPTALPLMANRCDGKHKCSIVASNLIFSNPCPGTQKYLEYSYTCVPPGT